nr:site-specific DNA-methyltransferase [Candidatus Sigynarchaeota archaeon]
MIDEHVFSRSSIDIIKSFLEEHGCKVDPVPFLNTIPLVTKERARLTRDIVKKIIRDSYNDASAIVKEISERLTDKFDVYLGRVHKRQLKQYIDYENPGDFRTFINLLNDPSIDAETIKAFCDTVIKNDARLLDKSLPVFWKNLNDAINANNKDRIKDYLVFLYSRLIALNENRQLSLKFLFDQEKNIIQTELDAENYRELEHFCADETLADRATIVSRFNKKYIGILEQSAGTPDKKALCYMAVDQSLFDATGSKAELYSYLQSAIQKSFDLLQNHRVLVIKIENIMDQGLNLKWDAYAYLTLYAEKLKPTTLNRTYYHGEDICADIIEHVTGNELALIDRERLKKHYTSPVGDDLTSSDLLSRADIQEIIKFYEAPLTGFSFLDCYILQQEKRFPNSREIAFVENNNELLLVFLKSVVDERKIPCPVCGSLKISGNSYSGIGEKSWECKNPLCADRSKTNRGKRYSMRTIFMQDSTYDFSKENIVPRELIKVWRKDLVERYDITQLYSMIIKYFTYRNDTFMAINPAEPASLQKIAAQHERKVEIAPFSGFVDITHVDPRLHEKFVDGPLFSQFVYAKRADDELAGAAMNDEIFRKSRKQLVYIVQDDCLHVLRTLGKESIHAAITSPPYYNAREYSQWTNLFTYLNDMYNVIAASREALVDGGIFFYNIGDIFDNERTIVKSTMGEKRIPLGAYIILLFQKAGFELLDNIAWYKGEPQSNRQKNDGNFVPFYQRPTNCYEHMFIFKKPGPLRLAKNRESNALISNVQKFSPVIKIGKGGVNKYGHTAPFPPDLPLLAINCFTEPGNFVLDPYSGSGTTPISASSCGRAGIGAEVSEDYARLSVEMARDMKLSVKLIKRVHGDPTMPWQVITFDAPQIAGKKQKTLESFTT